MSRRLTVIADGTAREHEVAPTPTRYDPVTTAVVISQDRFGNKTIASADFHIGEDGVAVASVIAEGFDLDKVWRKWLGLAREVAERAAQDEGPPQSQA